MFQNKKCFKAFAQKQTQNQICVTSSHTETGDFTHNEEYWE